MGAVYLGEHPMIGKKVAIKVLLPHLSSEPELVGRFLSEARAVNAIGHRGIVDIFSFGELPGGPHYFVMEFLEGTSFAVASRLRRSRATATRATGPLASPLVLATRNATRTSPVPLRPVRESSPTARSAARAASA